ncbi:MAG: hypothetical protein NTU88_11965, partial [Armatimonadetes bacterium]|nr:hypothetical protein [Armatimonadota bacterium]
GFLPGPDQYNHPDVTANVGYNAWYSYASPNLMQLTPGQNPVTKMWSAIPEIVLGVEVGGNGWDFSGKADSIALTGLRKLGPKLGCADRQGRGFVEENLLCNGGFRKGFDSWAKISGQNPGNPGQFLWTIDTTDGTPAPSFGYARTNSNNDGGKVGVYQEIGKRVTGWTSLTAKCSAKVLSNSLTDSGWYWPLNGGWGETPGRIIVHYMSNLSSGNINRATVKLYGADTNNDGTVDVLLNLPIVKPWCLGDGSLLVKFDRRSLSKALSSAPFADKSIITLVVTGSFLDGTAFSAADYIKVIGKTKPGKGPKK